jgi:hypothetical protein
VRPAPFALPRLLWAPGCLLLPAVPFYSWLGSLLERRARYLRRSSKWPSETRNLVLPVVLEPNFSLIFFVNYSQKTSAVPGGAQ